MKAVAFRAMNDAIPQLSAVVGAKVRELRQAQGATQEEVAAAARRCGLSWDRSTVTRIEDGARGLTAEELLLLPVLLGDILRRPQVPLTELLGEEAWLSDEIAYDPAAFRAALTGSGSIDVRRRSLDDIPGVPLYRAAFRAAAGEAEQRAARSLGVDAKLLSFVAHSRWDRSFTEERDRRVADRAPAEAPPRTVQALRGHITRALLAEMRQALDEGNNR
jgi:transcriptional regulator with XRE-family HTH domain